MATLGPTTAFWDCGEFITTSHIVGVPHQPGTPLYVLVGRVFDIVFWAARTSPQPAMRTAWAVNFMSAFFSALAVMFVYLIIWELARRADPDAGWLAHVGGVVGRPLPGLLARPSGTTPSRPRCTGCRPS